MSDPTPMTEREAYRMLGWPLQGGLDEPEPLRKLILPACKPDSVAEVWFVTSCEPCGMTGVARIGYAVEAGCGCCGKPFSRIIGR